MGRCWRGPFSKHIGHLGFGGRGAADTEDSQCCKGKNSFPGRMGRDVLLPRSPGLTPNLVLTGTFLSEEGLQGRATCPCQAWGRDDAFLCTTPGLSRGITCPSLRFFPKFVGGSQEKLPTLKVVMLARFLTPADVSFPS